MGSEESYKIFYNSLSKLFGFYVKETVNAEVCRNGQINPSIVLKGTFAKDELPVLIEYKSSFLECSGVAAYLEDAVHVWNRRDQYPGRLVYECKSLKSVGTYLDFSTIHPLCVSGIEYELNSDLVERGMKMFDRPPRPSAASTHQKQVHKK